MHGGDWAIASLKPVPHNNTKELTARGRPRPMLQPTKRSTFGLITAWYHLLGRDIPRSVETDSCRSNTEFTPGEIDDRRLFSIGRALKSYYIAEMGRIDGHLPASPLFCLRSFSASRAPSALRSHDGGAGHRPSDPAASMHAAKMAPEKRLERRIGPPRPPQPQRRRSSGRTACRPSFKIS